MTGGEDLLAPLAPEGCLCSDAPRWHRMESGFNDCTDLGRSVVLAVSAFSFLFVFFSAKMMSGC